MWFQPVLFAASFARAVSQLTMRFQVHNARLRKPKHFNLPRIAEGLRTPIEISNLPAPRDATDTKPHASLVQAPKTVKTRHLRPSLRRATSRRFLSQTSPPNCPSRPFHRSPPPPKDTNTRHKVADQEFLVLARARAAPGAWQAG